MSVADTPVAAADLETGPSSALITLVAISTGALVANLYYAQPLIASIAPEIGISPDLAGSVVSVTQIGYGAGLFLLVSLADLVENRQLVLIMLGFTTLGLIGAALSTTAVPFFLASFLIGLCSTGAQILIPLIAHLVPANRRGRVVGNVMAGVLTGIMLARPVALFIAASFGWRAVFWCSAVLMLGIGTALVRVMPQHKPRGGMHYGQILASMAGLLRDMPILRQRAVYQALMFAAFNLFWTAAPLMLAEHFGLNEHGIGLFALAGAGGALAAPIAGRLADRGLTSALTAGAMAALALCFYATGWAAAALALAVLLVLTIVIDAAVQVNQVVSQRLIFSGAPETRGRVNALYMTITFVGGALGSILGTVTYHGGGWTATATLGGLIGLLALALFALQARAPRAA
ncbi:MFS transporter [Bosea caraganae]|uniref:MFS transporter n=1 Tax=Bosea caraganae TaxID=2763117 RepID=A0A370L599_9HYPH|nr:MFS transporter [Bosea caraganae]RDJ24257.1 MFS transporter [Bosea caraganae]RDJ30299.1 MFS transporter [Bosea caraganae]